MTKTINYDMKYVFFMPTNDHQVVSFLVKNGHSVVFANEKNVKADIAIFTGGADVHPFLYGEDVLKSTSVDIRRDKREIKMFRSLPVQMPKVGICRGAQFLNVLSGGSLYQHVNKHTVPHDVYSDMFSTPFKVSSTHHQVMRPAEHGWVMWFAQESTEAHTDTEVINTAKNADFIEPELVWYENTNSLCFQGHPEYDGYPEFQEAFFENIHSMFQGDVLRDREKRKPA